MVNDSVLAAVIAADRHGWAGPTIEIRRRDYATRVVEALSGAGYKIVNSDEIERAAESLKVELRYVGPGDSETAEEWDRFFQVLNQE